MPAPPPETISLDLGRPLSREEQLDAALAELLDQVGHQEPAEWIRKHPEFADEITQFLAAHKEVAQHTAPFANRDRDSEPPPPGKLFGEYELLHEVARGGMGVVYRARQIGLNRVVALKMILGGRLADETQVRRFRAEAESVAQFSHPNIVAIYDVGQVEDQHFFSMEFIEGQSLAEMVRERPLPPQAAARYVQISAKAIEYAHSKDILHRDLKPSNILVDANDQPRITDFGLAKRMDDDTGLTADGFAVGTPSYMPPEQAAGLHDAMNRTSDVYSLGAILYELVTGRPPFKAATVMDTLWQVRESDAVPPRLLNPKVPRDLDTIIRKCLSKDQRHRYSTAAELTDDLERFQNHEPILAQRLGPLGRLTRWIRRHPVGAATLGGIMLTLLFATLAAASIARTMSSKRLQAVESSSRYAVRNIVNTVLRRLEHNAPRLIGIASDDELVKLLADPGDGEALQKCILQLHEELNGSPEPEQYLSGNSSASEPLRLANLFVLDPQGQALARSPHTDKWVTYVGHSWAERDYFLGGKALPAGKIYVSKAYKSNTDNKVKFALSAPVYQQAGGQSRLLGVLIATVETDRNLGLSEINDDEHHVVLLGQCDETSFSENERHAGDLRILVHPAYEKPGEQAHAVNDLRLTELVRKDAGAPTTTLVESLRDYRDPAGELDERFQGAMLASCAPIHGTPFLVLVQQRYDQAVGADSSLVWTLARWTGGAFALVVILVLMALRYAFRHPAPMAAGRISGTMST